MYILKAFVIDWSQFIPDLEAYFGESISKLTLVEVSNYQYNEQRGSMGYVTLRAEFKDFDSTFQGKGYTPVEVINDIINTYIKQKRLLMEGE